MKVVFIILVSVLFIGCSKTNISKKVIQNKSSQIIKVIKTSKIVDNKEVLIIEPNGEAIIENFSSSRSGPEYLNAENCTSFYTWYLSIEVNNNPSLKVTKDVSDSNNWTYKRSSSFNEVNVECRLIIKDSDIVPK